MAFRKKAHTILMKQPDILIVPECENQERLTSEIHVSNQTGIYWYGENPHKGIGVFSYNGYKIEPLSCHNPDFKYVIPLTVYNKEIEFIIFAVWAQKPERHDNYTEQVWEAVHYYSKLLDGDNIILAGDFNSNSIWDKPKRVSNHTNLVEFLRKKNIYSTYHIFHKLKQGQERDMTLYLYRKADRPYHIDYCFVSSNLIKKLEKVEVGTYEKWTKYSDHKPLFVTLKL
jgi:exodeoxyribonuclease-3